MHIPDGWELIENKLVREWRFADFQAAVQFIDRVAALAERHNHHPEIWNSYATVRLTLATHDAGDIATEKDTMLATEINSL